jgi:hypothetical protein
MAFVLHSVIANGKIVRLMKITPKLKKIYKMMLYVYASVCRYICFLRYIFTHGQEYKSYCAENRAMPKQLICPALKIYFDK